MSNKENAVFDYNNHLYILPYGDMAGNRWCDAIDVNSGMIIYHEPFPEFDMGQLFNTSQPLIRFHNDTLQTVYSKSYQWYLNGNPLSNDTGQTIVPSVSGLYKCLVTSLDNQSSFSFEKNIQITGIEKPSDDDIKFTISPNPTHNIFQTELNLKVKSFVKIEINNLMGENSNILFEGELNKGIQKHDFSI